MVHLNAFRVRRERMVEKESKVGALPVAEVHLVGSSAATSVEAGADHLDDQGVRMGR